MAVDSEDKAYVVGYTNGEISDPAVFGEENNQGGRDFFIVKFEEYFDANTAKYEGRIEWAEQFGTSGNELKVRSTGSDFANGVAYDGLDDSVLVAGNADGSIGGSENKGGTDGFLVKMNAGSLDGGPPPSDRKTTPLIFVPGVAGSQLLHDAQFDSVGEGGGRSPSEKWLRAVKTKASGDDEHLLDLELAADGDSPFGTEPEYRTRVGDILRREPRGALEDTPRISTDDYAGAIEGLEQAGYEEGQTLFLFPYDWRKDVRVVKGGGMLYEEDAAYDKRLVEFVDYVREKNRRPDGTLPKVDILAHSREGIVTYERRGPAARLLR